MALLFFFSIIKPVDIKAYDTPSTKFLIDLPEISAIPRQCLPDQINGDIDLFHPKSKLDRLLTCSTRTGHAPKRYVI